MSFVRRTLAGAALVAAGIVASHAAPAAKGRQAAQCRVGLVAALDRDSFAGHGFSAARLATFEKAAEEAFRKSAEALCRSGRIRPAALRPYRRLIVQSGSGAVDVAVYTDPARFGRTSIVFQWIFNEERLALPDAADIAQGLLCWSDPEAADCAMREP